MSYLGALLFYDVSLYRRRSIALLSFLGVSRPQAWALPIRVSVLAVVSVLSWRPQLVPRILLTLLPITSELRPPLSHAPLNLTCFQILCPQRTAGWKDAPGFTAVLEPAITIAHRYFVRDLPQMLIAKF